MRGIRPLLVCAVLGLVGVSADVAEAALAKKAGGSGYSGTLSSNAAIRRQQLICDPDEPIAGSTSVLYDPGIVTVAGLSFGPGYVGSGRVEVISDNETFLVDLDEYVAEKFGQETGYLQIQFGEPQVIPSAAAAAVGHGQILPPTGFFVVDEDGPAAVDTHALLFDYRQGVGDERVAEYKIFGDPGERGSGNGRDFLRGVDENGQAFDLGPTDVAPATVRGSLNVVPVPPAALIGGLTLGGMAVARKLRRRR